MKKCAKCLYALAAVLVGISISSTSHAATNLGTDNPGNNRCVHTGHTWLTRGKVYGQIDTKCSAKLRNVEYGVRVQRTGQPDRQQFYQAIGENFQTFWIRTVLKCDGTERSGWGGQSKI